LHLDVVRIVDINTGVTF